MKWFTKKKKPQTSTERIQAELDAGMYPELSAVLDFIQDEAEANARSFGDMSGMYGKMRREGLLK